MGGSHTLWSWPSPCRDPCLFSYCSHTYSSGQAQCGCSGFLGAACCSVRKPKPSKERERGRLMT